MNDDRTSIVNHLRRRAEHFDRMADIEGRAMSSACDRLRKVAGELRAAAAEVARGDDKLPPV